MNIFDNKTKVFFENNMCIDISIYEARITQYSKKDIEYFRELGQFLLECDIDSPVHFRDDCRELQRKYNVDCDESIETSHVLTHAVKLFREKNGGLLSLFVFTESDSWEPLPIIENSLYLEMNKEDQAVYEGLPSKVMLYRGTGLKEYETGVFGQSWTLNKSVAEKFAFTLPQEKDINHGVRVVVSVLVDKKSIYAYSNQNEEALCIVAPGILMAKDVKREEVNEK